MDNKPSNYERVTAAGLLVDIGWDLSEALVHVGSKGFIKKSSAKGLTLSKLIESEIQEGALLPPPDEVLEGVQDYPLVDSQPLQHDIPEAPQKKFKILGYSGDNYYYFPYSKKQIVALTPGGHSIQNLLQLADLWFWRENYGGKDGASDGRISLAAANDLIKRATARGIFDESVSVRGCGAWMDAGRVILHCGDRLYVDGKETDIIDLKSKYTYVASAKLMSPHNEPLSNAEAYQLRVLCEMPSWENKLSGSLLAGWLVVAPICAALEWRPHIWVTGQAESGKSTIMDKIISRVLGSFALRLDGGTTEPAIRSMMRYDARPVIYDEAEGGGKYKNIMAGVMALVRLASSGGTVGKFGQTQFTARFMTCFSAIRPPIREFADETRISQLRLKQNRSATASDDYRVLLLAIESTITEDFAARMLSRILLNMPVLLANIKTFRKAASAVIKGARASDQIAPMLAGLFFLHGTNEVSQERAEEFIKQQDWSFHTAIAEDNDPTRCIQHLCGHTVKYTPSNGSAVDVSIGDLLDSCQKINQDINIDWSRKTLRASGILVKEDGIVIANRSAQLEKIFKDTPWSVGWKSALEAIEGSKKLDKTYFSSGNEQKATWLPLGMFKE
jgi:putative DNA primase/helicase